MTGADAAPARYRPETLRGFAGALATQAGLPRERAAVMAEILVEADMMGRSTHGIEQLDRYLDDLVADLMNKTGEHEPVADNGAALTWDGHFLPGTWLVTQALAAARERIGAHPVVTVVVRDSHHVGFHAAYLRRATEHGLAIMLLDTNPRFGTVAPYGGRRAVFSPTPVSFGFPTAGDPILVDITTSVTAEGKVRVARYAGKELAPGQILDRDGNPSTRPDDLYNGGSMLPLGGLMGHKGYGLSVVVDLLGALLTGGSAGGKRGGGFSNNLTLWAADPDALGGRETMEELQSEYFAMLKSSNRQPGVEEILLPGEPELRTAADRRRDGLPLDAGTVSGLDQLAIRLGLTPLSSQALKENG